MQPRTAVALQWGDVSITFADLAERITERCIRIKNNDLDDGVTYCGSKSFYAIIAKNDLAFIVNFLAFLQSRVAIAILSPYEIAKETEERLQLLSMAPCHPDTAVILFTSGSSGKPKAVQLSLGNILSNREAVRKSLQFNSVTEQTLFLPLSYSFGLLGQLLPALAEGFCTKLAPDLIAAAESLRNGTAQGMWSGVPSHWETICRLCGDQPLPKVTHVVSAGAPLSVTLRRKLLQLFPFATIFNNYGLTEASPRILSMPSTHSHFLVENAVGYPVGDWQIQIDENGEVLAKGSQVMLGYLNDDFAHSERIQNGWLRTGDRGSINESGCVFLYGRNDDLFKLGGEKVSILEIEAALYDINGITEAAVTLVEDSLLGTKVIAILVWNDNNKSLQKKEIVTFLKNKISLNKIPREFYQASKLPKNTNGKLNRSQLKSLVVPEAQIK